MTERNRLVDIRLDEASLAAATPDADHERRIAVFDLLEKNAFTVVGIDLGPYVLDLSLADQRLVFAISAGDGQEVRRLVLALGPFRKVIKDYFLICASYHDAIRHATAAQIEAIDMGRRGLHNEGSELLSARLADKLTMDFDTSRRLFTLICALHVRT
jgi:uncharacterized protein (UPF0262 family)